MWYIHLFVCVHAEARGQLWLGFSIPLQLFESLIESGAHCFVSELARPAGPGSFLTHPHSAPELQMLATEPGFLHMGTRTQVSMLVQPALYSLASSLAPNEP